MGLTAYLLFFLAGLGFGYAASGRWKWVPLAFPLLLGIGVDSGVHLVHRAREVPVASGRLLSGTTTQAVLYSALTTLASFGTLVLSDHRGIASLGELLVVGMGFTLLGNLVLLPALLTLWQRRRAGPDHRSDP